MAGPSQPPIPAFISNIIANGGLAKPSRFLVGITPPPIMSGIFNAGSLPLSAYLSGQPGVLASLNTTASSLMLQCEAAELPGITMATQSIRIYGPSGEFPYQKTFNNWTAEFFVTNTWKEKQFFDAWMESISPTSTFNFAYKQDYATIISIYQFDEGGGTLGSLITEIPGVSGVISLKDAQVTYAVDLIEAWPIALSDMPLSWGDEGYHKFSVTFSYRYWEPNDTAFGTQPFLQASLDFFNNPLFPLSPTSLALNPYTALLGTSLPQD